MKFKRLISGLIAAAVAVSTAAFSSFSTFGADGTVVSGSCGDNATWFINSDDTLVISGTGTVSSYKGWHNYSSSIKRVVVEEGITEISSNMFTYCVNVKEIVLPSSLEKLGHCFSDRLKAMTDVWMFSKVIENGFTGNSGSYPNPGSGTKWHVYKDSTTEASFKEGLKYTDADLEYITESESFPEVKNREPLVLATETETSGPAGIKSSWSWNETTKTLTFSGSGEINIKNGFQKFTSLVETVDMENSEITGVCDAAFGASDTYSAKPTLCPKLTHLTLPSTLTSIGDHAFNSAPITEENLYLPEGLTKIGEKAFFGTNITGHLALPSTVESVGQLAFSATKISSVDIPEGVTFGGTVFYECDLITEIRIPKGLSYIKNGEGNASRANKLFSSCDGIKTVIIEEGATIAEAMFTGCNAVSDVYILAKSVDIAGPKKNTANQMFDGDPLFHVYKGSTTESNVESAGYANIAYLADITELEKAIADASKIDSDICTEESANALSEAVASGKEVVSDIYATDTDASNAAKAINNAISGLVYKPADYTAVDAAKAKVPADLSVYTNETAKAVTDAVAAVAEGKNITEQDIVDAYAKAIEDAVLGLELKTTGTLSGTITVSDKNAETELTVKAVAADGTEITATAASMGEYVIEGLEEGSCTLVVEGGNYTSRSYEITVGTDDIKQDVELNLIGDVNGDGKITTADVGMANSHAKGVNLLEGYKFDCANVKVDEVISTADVGMINSHAKSVKSLW